MSSWLPPEHSLKMGTENSKSSSTDDFTDTASPLRQPGSITIPLASIKNSSGSTSASDTQRGREGPTESQSHDSTSTPLLVIDLTQDSDEEDETGDQHKLAHPRKSQRTLERTKPLSASVEPDVELSLKPPPISSSNPHISTDDDSLQPNEGTTGSSIYSQDSLGATKSRASVPSSGTSAAEPVPHLTPPKPLTNYGVDTTQSVSKSPITPCTQKAHSASSSTTYSNPNSQPRKQLPRLGKEWVDTIKVRIQKKHESEEEGKGYATREPPKRKRAKKPLCKPKSKHDTDGKSTPKRLKVLGVYDFGETVSESKASWRSLPPLDCGYNKHDLSLQDALVLETNSKAFDDAFADVVNKVSTDLGREQFPTPESLDNDNSLPINASECTLAPTQQLTKPTFLGPNTIILYLNIQGTMFSLYRNFVVFHAPKLYKESFFAISPQLATFPASLGECDPKVFGWFQNWLYSNPNASGLVSKLGGPPFQDRCMRLWILGKSLNIPELQNDAIDALEARRRHDGKIETNILRFVYANTVKGDGLRSYMIHICAGTSFDEDVIRDKLPLSFINDMDESKPIKIEGEQTAADKVEVNTRLYHVNII